MAPQIRTGDVVLIDGQKDQIGVGSVVAFAPSGQDMVLHRVVGQESVDRFITKGDANGAADSDLVALNEILGTGRLLVPYAGMPRLWGAGLPFAIIAVLFALTIWRRQLAGALALLVTGLALGGITIVGATFASVGSNAGSSFDTATAAPPTGLAATCGAIGAVDVKVELTWTASTSAGLAGYQILADAPTSGTNFTLVGTVAPSQTSFTHSMPVATLSAGTHTYAVVSELGPWLSPMSDPDAVSLTEVLLVWTCTEL